MNFNRVWFILVWFLGTVGMMFSYQNCAPAFKSVDLSESSQQASTSSDSEGGLGRITPNSQPATSGPAPVMAPISSPNAVPFYPVPTSSTGGPVTSPPGSSPPLSPGSSPGSTPSPSPGIITIPSDDLDGIVDIPQNIIFSPGGITLRRGQSLRNELHSLTLQTDGNLVIRRHSDGRVIWNSAPQVGFGDLAVFQADGNFVIYNSKSVALGHSGTANQKVTMVFGNDGHLTILRNPDGYPLWSTEKRLRVPQCWSQFQSNYVNSGSEQATTYGESDEYGSFYRSIPILAVCMANGHFLYQQTGPASQFGLPNLTNPAGLACEYNFEGVQRSLGPNDRVPFTDSSGRQWTLSCGSVSHESGSTPIVWKLLRN